MKTNAATATIFTTTLCFIFINTVMAPFALADDMPVSSNAGSNTTAPDFPLIVPDATNSAIPDTFPEASSAAIPVAVPSSNVTSASNSAIPGLESFDLSANRNYQLPSQALPPSTDVLPSQSVDSASTPNAGGQMPLIPQTPKAAITSPAQGFSQTGQTETQTAQEWRKAAFESLTNNPNVQPMFGRTQSQNASASANSNSNGVTENNNVNTGNGAPGNNPNASPMGMTAMNNNLSNAGMPNQPAQSQTLTGPSSNQQQGQATKKSSNNGGGYNSGLTGVTRFASMFTMMGAGMMMGTMMRR
ncbi:MAG: hypothetical protein P4L53_24645 [Candidatus Obscuribacterales bacterium]|nr:hypothetical protein [Candidatus Obscuribacterales bacterium]